MSTTFSKPMFWGEQNCIQPTEIANAGYVLGDNPAAEHENYFRHQTYLCLQELQKAVNTLEAETVAEAGLCGENVFYLLRKDGTMTITGTGSIADHQFQGRNDISEVKINISGSVGTEAFSGCEKLTSMCVDCSIIGDRAFADCHYLQYLSLGKGISKIGSYIVEDIMISHHITTGVYQGTTAEFLAIARAKNWAAGHHFIGNKVTCTDGEILIGEELTTQ